MNNCTYEIFQSDNRDYTFMSFSYAMENGFCRSDYKSKYTGVIDMTNKAIGSVLDEIFMIHNRDDRPNGKTMRSLSVSDVVVLDGKPYYCDSFFFGWSEIPADRW